LAVFTTAVITNYTDHSGLFIFWGMIAYTIRLYCDFSGIIDIVIGTSKCFGIKLDENFRQPFFSHSISEFWRRWHITLSDWFKEYVFYPVSMSKPILAINKGLLKIKFNHYWASFIPTALSVIFIWALTGVWHGSSLVYLVYGVYYGLIMVFEMMLDHINLYGKVKINPIYKVFSSIVVFVLVNIGLSLFCSSQLSDFNEKMRLLFIADEDSIITIFSLREVLISLFGFFIVCLVDIIQYSGKQIKFLNSKVFKYGAIVCLFIGVVVFGAYGMGYDYIEPIYDEF
jgi:alginate O-acetyltransferase complex protein AlgI